MEKKAARNHSFSDFISDPLVAMAILVIALVLLLLAVMEFVQVVV